MHSVGRCDHRDVAIADAAMTPKLNLSFPNTRRSNEPVTDDVVTIKTTAHVCNGDVIMQVPTQTVKRVNLHTRSIADASKSDELFTTISHSELQFHLLAVSRTCIRQMYDQVFLVIHVILQHMASSTT